MTEYAAHVSTWLGSALFKSLAFPNPAFLPDIQFVLILGSGRLKPTMRTFLVALVCLAAVLGASQPAQAQSCTGDSGCLYQRPAQRPALPLDHPRLARSSSAGSRTPEQVRGGLTRVRFDRSARFVVQDWHSGHNSRAA